MSPPPPRLTARQSMLGMSFAIFFDTGAPPTPSFPPLGDPNFLISGRVQCLRSALPVACARAQLHMGSRIGGNCFKVLSEAHYLTGLGLANHMLQKLGSPPGGRAATLLTGAVGGPAFQPCRCPSCLAIGFWAASQVGSGMYRRHLHCLLREADTEGSPALTLVADKQPGSSCLPHLPSPPTSGHKHHLSGSTSRLLSLSLPIC